MKYLSRQCLALLLGVLALGAAPVQAQESFRVGFVDVGNVFGENEQIRAGDLRASAGLGLSWLSPIGPLRLAIAKPVRKFAGDRIQKLQFQIGTSF